MEVVYSAKTNEIKQVEKIQTAEELESQTRIKNMFKIAELKQNLSETDYQAIKFAEGQLSEEEYEPIKKQRQLWRDEINNREKN